MKIALRLVAVVISLLGSINLSSASQSCFHSNPRAWDEGMAKNILSNFLVMCANEPGNVYETITDEPWNTAYIKTLRADVISEHYLLVNFWQDLSADNKNATTPGGCYWFFIPCSLQESYKSISQELRLYLSKSTIKYIKTDFLNPEDHIISDRLSRFLEGWMLQDSFTRPVKIGAAEEYDVSFTSFFHKDKRKVMYIGVSLKKPSWISDSASSSCLSNEDESSEQEVLSDESTGSHSDNFYSTSSGECASNDENSDYSSEDINTVSNNNMGTRVVFRNDPSTSKSILESPTYNDTRKEEETEKSIKVVAAKNTLKK